MFVLEKGRVRFIPPIPEFKEIEDRGYFNFNPTMKTIDGDIEYPDISTSYYYECGCLGNLETSCYQGHVYYSEHNIDNHSGDDGWLCPSCSKELDYEFMKKFECYCGSLLDNWHGWINMWC